MTRSARLVDDSGNTLLTLDDSPDTGLTLTSLDLGYATVRESTSSLAGQDGELDLTQFTGGRAITAEVGFPVTAGALIDTVRGLMHPGRRMWLQVQMDGWAGERRIRVRGAALTAPTGPLPWTAQLGWKAPGGTLEDVTLSSATLNPAAQPGGGRTYPKTYPWSYAAGLAPGASILTVAGNANAKLTVDIYGPCSAPLFEVIDNGGYLSFPNLTIAQGDYLHIDTAARSITLNDSAAQPRYNTLDFATAVWPSLPHGSPQVIFSPASSDAGCSAVVTWRSTWS